MCKRSVIRHLCGPLNTGTAGFQEKTQGKKQNRSGKKNHQIALPKGSGRIFSVHTILSENFKKRSPLKTKKRKARTFRFSNFDVLFLNEDLDSGRENADITS
ncbi:hypothetical protein LEP1GSC060_3814 [Leptospira weilii serovar Ranarum str. ICFT]|uniref:Uncharacterized protein n=1 Tax=Leptospira weilii serovar Ranarum str. ICFT TaxID=1218598 RepID=N1WHT3_9LEPT|nr:hypothetical protein LEP1GSC060_3814 [Leptospira weilii serovar Ranarum str. ICFT]